MPKKNLSVAMAYVGVVAGAGLASGQDLLQYFLSFGVMGVLGIAVMGGLNVVFGSLALQLGSYFRSDHHDEVFGRIAHPVVNRLIDIVLVASSFIMGFVMLAGAGANLQQAFGLPTMWGAVVAFTFGFYDGFFGPGTGSFMLFAFLLVGFDFLGAAANARALNFASNLAAVVLFAYFGLVDFTYAIPMGISMIVGAWCGARLAIKKGSSYVRPLFIAVTTVLIGKQLFDLFGK